MVVVAVAVGPAVRAGTEAAAARADPAKTVTRMIRDDLVIFQPPFQAWIALGGNHTGSALWFQLNHG